MPDEILREKIAAVNHNTVPKRPRGSESEIHKMVTASVLSSSQVAKVSEAAAMLRMLASGFNVFGSVFDGDRTDWIVEVPCVNAVYKVQVKTTFTSQHGLPYVSLRHRANPTDGNRRYNRDEFDFIVGYDLLTDTAYVWSWEEVEHLQSAVSVNNEAAERWDKMRGSQVRILPPRLQHQVGDRAIDGGDAPDARETR